MGSPAAPSPARELAEPTTDLRDRAEAGAEPRRRRGWLRPIFALLLGTIGLRLLLWSRAYGFEQGDPVEYVNIAYKIAFGIGIPWWDLRPLLLPLIYVPVLYLGQLWPDPTGEVQVRLLRMVSVLFSLGSVWLVYLLGRRLGGEVVGLVAALLVAVNPVFNSLSVNTYAEVPSTFFVLLAIWLLTREQPRPMLAGLALGAACMIRYQAIAYLAPIGLWVLIREARGEEPRANQHVILSGAKDLPNTPGRLVRSFAPLRMTIRSPLASRLSPLRFVAGLGVAVFAQAVVESVAYGRPFHSLLVSFQYNVTSGLAPVEFGAEPFEWFLLRVDEWFGIVPLVLAALGLPTLRRGPRAAEWRLVGLAAATMFLFLSALPHKELRFMAQVSPLVALFVGEGVVRVAGWLARKPSSLSVTLFASMLILLTALPLLWASLRLELGADIAYVDGPKRAAEIKPGGVMGTIPWFVPRPYTGTRLTLERMDRRVWDDRDHVTRTVETSDFLLFPEYWLLEDRFVRRLVDERFRTIESYENGVVLLQNRRLDEPARRRSR